MAEVLVDFYLEKIKEQGVDHANTLQNFYNSLFDVKLSNIVTFRKLIKLYGVKRVFSSILSAYDVENFRPESPYGMLAYFCKKDLQDIVIPTYIDLKKLERKHYKVKFTDPFDEA